MKLLLIACAGLLVAACTTSLDADRCAGYGYKPGSEAYAGCMERASLHRGQAIGQAFTNLSRVRAAQAASLRPVTMAPDRVICTRNALTGAVICQAM